MISPLDCLLAICKYHAKSIKLPVIRQHVYLCVCMHACVRAWCAHVYVCRVWAMCVCACVWATHIFSPVMVYCLATACVSCVIHAPLELHYRGIVLFSVTNGSCPCLDYVVKTRQGKGALELALKANNWATRHAIYTPHA